MFACADVAFGNPPVWANISIPSQRKARYVGLGIYASLFSKRRSCFWRCGVPICYMDGVGVWGCDVALFSSSGLIPYMRIDADL